MNNKTSIPITVEQAYACLEINDEQKVHSLTVWQPGLFAGADLGLEKVRSVLENAANENQLFLSYVFDCTDHNIAAFNRQCEE